MIFLKLATCCAMFIYGIITKTKMLLLQQIIKNVTNVAVLLKEILFRRIFFSPQNEPAPPFDETAKCKFVCPEDVRNL